jgi:glutaredoxin 3
MNVVVYTKSGCTNCVTAKLLLKSKELTYQEFDVGTPDGLVIFQANVSAQHRQLPQIFINNQRVGGLAGLQEALKLMGYV